MDASVPAAEGLAVVTSAEGSTAAPDTPVSSDFSAPSASGAVPRRPVAAASYARPCSRTNGRSLDKEPSLDGWASSEARTIPSASLHMGRASSNLATMLLHRPLGSGLASSEASLPRSARSPGRACGPRTVIGPAAARAPTSMASRASTPATCRGVPSVRSPGRNSVRSPNRSRGNSPQSSPPRPPRAAVSREQFEAIEQHKAYLEWQVHEGDQTQMALEQMLHEERIRGASDRAKLLALGERIEQLEHTRGAARVAEENRCLHTEMEAQSRQLEMLRQQVEMMRGGGQDAAPSAEPELREENLRLRRDLEQSREMLSRYTEELACIMPGMQKVLQKFSHEETCRSPRESDDAQRQRRELVAKQAEAERLSQASSGLSLVQPQPQPQTLLGNGASSCRSGNGASSCRSRSGASTPSQPGTGHRVRAFPASEAEAPSSRRPRSSGLAGGKAAARPSVAFGSRVAAQSPLRNLDPVRSNSTGADEKQTLRRRTPSPKAEPGRERPRWQG
mmetsp:Transcript_103141/g.183269  ORF Transcript_103141/g.183269 Transcript_103141/m.183269 type:complete len:507 (+) Transcript_103141:53-1573(+)